MGQVHTRLAATMLLALGSLTTAADAVRAEAVVVAATAPGYTAGQQLGTDSITVPDGATLVFLLKTGQVVTVKGPYEGPPPAPTGDAGNRFDRLTRLGGTDQAEIGDTRACRDNRSVLYQRLPKMFADLALARGDGRYPRLMRAVGGVKLLILDDWGLEPLGPEQRRDMLEIVEERYGRGATLITSQIPVDRWHDLIGDPTLGDAILDRVIHNAHRLQLSGESLRKKVVQAAPA
jgi:hypothetical protein